MGISRLIGWMFKKPITSVEQEELYENEILEYNRKNPEKIYATVIQYDVVSENDVPVIIKICDFHNEILPDKGSIIWAPDKQKSHLIPYKVERFDFIEDLGTDNYSPYIVVTDASIKDITKITNYE